MVITVQDKQVNFGSAANTRPQLSFTSTFQILIKTNHNLFRYISSRLFETSKFTKYGRGKIQNGNHRKI